MNIEDNVRRVRDRIHRAADRAGRDPRSLTLVAVSKTVPADRIRQATEAGIEILGENRVQEAREKISRLASGLTWHMVGYLQRNKAREAARLFQMVQSVDRFALGEVLSGAAKERPEPLPVLVQVNLGGESTKAGTAPETLSELVKGLSGLDGIRVRGLMAIPPPAARPEEMRPHFRLLRELAERLAGLDIPRVEMRELSIGMTADFEVAIEEGATMVRVGTAIFGVRDEGGHGR